MNRYLDEETKKSLEEKMLRFDDREMTGKVVAKAIYGGDIAAIVFTDGTWSAFCAQMDIDSAELYHVSRYDGSMDLHDLEALGLITEGQFTVARDKEKARERKYKQEQLEMLQRELESESKSDR